jgi:hypothetical protein
MATYLRLRQICLVAPHLQPMVSDIAGIMGLDVCHDGMRSLRAGTVSQCCPFPDALEQNQATYRPLKFAVRRSSVALTPSLKSSVARSLVCSPSS